MFEQVEINGKPLKIPAILPKLSETPGRTDWPGGEVGSHTQDILKNILNLSVTDIDQLKEKGVI
jgi:crotonobetainyl-CoA:carnitine CoA-transferase CaiB-like acyl-CoA transferase